MPLKEPVSFLARVSNLDFNTQKLRDTAEQIVKTLGYLPLAIDLAGGYLSNSNSDLARFLPTYKLHARSLLSKIPNDGMLGYKNSAFTTWEMSFERMSFISPAGASLIQVLGFVHNRDICDLPYTPINITEMMALMLPSFKEDSKGWDLRDNSYRFNEAFTYLSKLCLIRRIEKARSLIST